MSRRAGLVAAAATGIQVGLGIVATRFVVDQAGPVSLAFFRYALAFLCLLPVALKIAPWPFARRDVIPVVLLGIVQCGLVIVFLNIALQYIPSARASLIFATFPLLTMVLSVLFGKEAFSARVAFAVIVTIIGVGLALGEKVTETAIVDEGWIGELAAFAAALSGAACSIFYRPYLMRYPTVSVGSLAMLASVIFLAAAAVPEGLFETLPAFTDIGWLAVIFIGVGSGASYFLWLYALSNAGATEVTIYLGLSPVTAALGGAVLLGEIPGIATFAGLVLVLAGLWLASRQQPPPTTGAA